MQRAKSRGTKEQSLLILLLLVLIAIVVFINIGLGAINKHTRNSKIEVLGSINIKADIINGQNLTFSKEDIESGKKIFRTLQIIKPLEVENFSFRISATIRIKGNIIHQNQNLIKFSIPTEQGGFEWHGGEWYYSDYATVLEYSLVPQEAQIQLLFEVNPFMEEDISSKDISVVLYIDTTIT